jgi:uncharacterized protein YukE
VFETRKADFSTTTSEAEKIIEEVRAMRRSILDAWQERGVVLTKDEQRELAKEIKLTCELLADLTTTA